MDEKMIEHLVWAWRTAKQIADGMENALGVSLDSMVDVHGNILDAIRLYAGEHGDLDDSDVLRFLESENCTRLVAIAIRELHNQNNHTECPMYVQQPAPKFFTDEQIRRMQEVFGGYVTSVNGSAGATKGETHDMAGTDYLR